MTKHNAVSVHLVSAEPDILPGARPDKRRVLSRYQSYVLTANDPVQCILPVDPDRVEYTIIALDNDVVLGPTKGVAGASVNTGTSGAAASGGVQAQSLANTGSQTTPGAGTTIASVALTAGVWTVAWTVQLGGTLAAADANNFGLNNGASQVEQSMNTATAGQFVQVSTTLVIAAGGATVAIKAIALATTGAVYTAQMVATPAVSPVVASTLVTAPNANGGYIPKQLNVTLQDTGQVYCGVTTTASNSRVTVIDTYYEAPDG